MSGLLFFSGGCSRLLDSSTGQWEVHKDVSPLDDSLPALFHCSAGTDRTGMVAALVRADSLHRLDAASQQALLALDDSLPALFHCSAGTDRTGMVAALVPGIAGVAPEVIARE